MVLSRKITLRDLGDAGMKCKPIRCGEKGMLYGWLHDLVDDGLAHKEAATVEETEQRGVWKFWLTTKGWAEYDALPEVIEAKRQQAYTEEALF